MSELMSRLLKNQHNVRYVLRITIAGGLLALTLGYASPSSAGLPPQLEPPNDPGGERMKSPFPLNPGHLWPGDHQPSGGDTIQGVVDRFGYTVDDTVPFNWIDASGGAEATFSGEDDSTFGPVEIGFPFRYYERTYTSLYISTNGILSFEQPYSAFNNNRLPMDAPPNDFLAVFWDDLVVGGDFNAGKVYYRTGGTAPNRYLVVEWYQVTRLGSSQQLTFEAVLYESGNIRFQYLDLNGTLNQATVGIEDGDGVDGLLYLYNAPGLSNGLAVRFSRPAASFRVKSIPAYWSGLVVNKKADLQVAVRNIGDLGPDVYDLTVSVSDPDWTVTLLGAEGGPIGDSDSDGLPDTGLLNQGDTLTVTLQVAPALDKVVGEYVDLQFTARSSQNSAKSAVTDLVIAIPLSFAQAYANGVDGMNLDLVWTQRRNTLKVAQGFSGSSLALGTGLDGRFTYAWEKNGINNSGTLFANIEVQILDRHGNLLGPLRVIADNRTASLQTTDRFPALAVAPDGTVGVLWVRDLFDFSIFKSNSNVYFAALAPDGGMISGPTRVTDNDAWRGEGDENVPVFTSPRLEATEDQRFVMAWVDGRLQSAGETGDISLSVYDLAGNELVPAMQFTQSQPGGTRFLDPSLIALPEARTLLVYTVLDIDEIDYSLSYAVLNSAGGIWKAPGSIPGASGWGPDATLLDDGRVLIAWSNPTMEGISFAVLGAGSYNHIHGPVSLTAPDGRQADFLSITHDRGVQAVITWMDAEWNQRLYYAVADNEGSLLTPALIYRSGTRNDPLILSSFAGQGNAHYEGKWELFLPVAVR